MGQNKSNWLQLKYKGVYTGHVLCSVRKNLKPEQCFLERRTSIMKKQLAGWLLAVCYLFSSNAALAQEIPRDEEPPIDTPAPADGADKDKIRKKLRADFMLEFDYGQEIINLTQHRQPTIYESASDTLIYGDYSAGFRVTKFHEITAGLGGVLRFNYPNRTGLRGDLWAHVGLMPYIGRQAVSHQFQPTLEKAFNAKMLKAPVDASAFASWSVEDSVNFSSTGGLIFSVGVGVPGVDVGSDYIVEGTFATYIEKVSPTEVYVMLSTINAKSLSMQADATLVGVGVSKYKELEQGMSYMINYADPVGAKAYYDLIRGNVAAIQELVNDPTVTAIQKWEKLSRMQMRRMSFVNVGIPWIINWGWQSGKIYEFTDTTAFYNETRAEADYGIYIKEKRKRIFMKSTMVKTEAFYGTVSRLYNYANDLMMKYYFGQYVYNADDYKTDKNDMQKTVADLIQKTGLSQQLAINIPKHKNLHFSRINLTVNFDEDQTIRLMNIVANIEAKALAHAATQKAEMFLQSESNALSLCSSEEVAAPMSAAECLTKCAQENTEASSDLVRLAKIMKAHFEAGRDKEFAIAYANFGKAMLRNATMFQTIIGFAGEGVEIVYDIYSTHFSHYRVVYMTTEAKGVYKRMSEGTQNTWVFAEKTLNNALSVAGL